jgi:hypothetical protein
LKWFYVLLERVMGFAPTTSSLARKRSTAELHPRIYSSLEISYQTLAKNQG